MFKGKKYFHEKMTAEQKDKLKESNPKLYSFMFDERVKNRLNPENKKEEVTNQ